MTIVPTLDVSADDLNETYARAINAAIETGRDDLVQDLADAYAGDLRDLERRAA